MWKAKKYFIDYIKDKIKKYKRVIIEGTIKDIDMINKIIDNKCKFVFVAPIDEKTYLYNLTDRFVESPDNYGRINFIAIKDTNKDGLNDYKKNGINGKIITKLLKDVAHEQYKKICDLYDYYANHFNVKKVYNNRTVEQKKK